MHLLFLELDTNRPYLDFKILDENNNNVTPKTSPAIKWRKSIYDNKASKIYPDLNPTASQEPQTYRLKKLTVIEAYLLDEIEVRERIAKKWNESIQ